VERRKILLLPGLELRPLGRPARSQSPYRLGSEKENIDVASPVAKTNTETESRIGRFWSDNLKGRNLLKEPGLDGRIILNRLFKNQEGSVWFAFAGLRIESSGDDAMNLRVHKRRRIY
jgi:hypothetical protein